MPKASDFPGHNRPWYVCWEKIYFTRFQPGAYDFHDGFWKYFKSRDHAHGDSSSPRSCWRFPNAWCSNLGASNQLFYNRIFQPVPASNITAREHFEKETCPKHDILTMCGSQLAWITKKSSLFDMRMHIRIWGLDGWQQWSSPSDFENLDFSLRVCHVAHSSGWIDLPVCGLKIYHLEINWSGTFRKQMCYLTIGSANLFFEHGHVYIYIYILYFKVFHFSARSATIAVPTKDCYSHIAALRPLHSQICALGNRTASFFNFYTLSILEVDDSSAAELCGYQHPSLVGFSERMRICCVNYIYIYICTSVMMAIDGP